MISYIIDLEGYNYIYTDFTKVGHTGKESTLIYRYHSIKEDTNNLYVKINHKTEDEETIEEKQITLEGIDYITINDFIKNKEYLTFIKIEESEDIDIQEDILLIKDKYYLIEKELEIIDEKTGVLVLKEYKHEGKIEIEVKGLEEIESLELQKEDIDFHQITGKLKFGKNLSKDSKIKLIKKLVLKENYKLLEDKIEVYVENENKIKIYEIEEITYQKNKITITFENIEIKIDVEFILDENNKVITKDKINKTDKITEVISKIKEAEDKAISLESEEINLLLEDIVIEYSYDQDKNILTKKIDAKNRYFNIKSFYYDKALIINFKEKYKINVSIGDITEDIYLPYKLDSAKLENKEYKEILLIDITNKLENVEYVQGILRINEIDNYLVKEIKKDGNELSINIEKVDAEKNIYAILKLKVIDTDVEKEIKTKISYNLEIELGDLLTNIEGYLEKN